MKKNLFGAFALIMAFITSCTNDDITISHTTNFKINPSTVIAPFTWEWQAGDLESFDTDYQLRIRLLIYGTDGILVKEDTQYFTNYSVIMNSGIALPQGSYTAIAITDIIGKASGTVAEYWTLSDHQRLADTYINDAGYIGGKNKILGISKQDFSVDGTSQSDITINVQPTGAIYFIWYQNIHTFPDVVTIGLETSKIAEQCVFNMDGSYSITAQNNNGSFDWWIDFIDVTDYPSSSGVYGYYYILPVSNQNLRFTCLTENEQIDLSSIMTITPQAGDEWAFILNLKDEESGKITAEYGKVNGSDTRSLSIPHINTLEEVYTPAKGNKLYLKDIK